jgi:hypothetical protein
MTVALFKVYLVGNLNGVYLIGNSDDRYIDGGGGIMDVKKCTSSRDSGLFLFACPQIFSVF